MTQVVDALLVHNIYYLQGSSLFKFVYTVEPPNKGHVGTRSFILYREVSYIRRLKCTGIIKIGRVDLSFKERCSLFGVSFIGGSTVYL